MTSGIILFCDKSTCTLNGIDKTAGILQRRIFMECVRYIISMVNVWAFVTGVPALSSLNLKAIDVNGNVRYQHDGLTSHQALLVRI